MDIVSRFLSLVAANKIGSKKILLACSGGADSVALFHLFYAHNIYFEVAHVNYALRGKESEENALFVKNLCKNHQVKYHLLNAPTIESKKGVQAKARKIRYDFFKQIIISNHLALLATAHHRDDLIENSIFRFMRGTGLKGLIPMQTLQKQIFRPLLHFNKNEILSFLKEQNLDFSPDSSNQGLNYSRNIIRNKVIPVFETIFKDYDTRILHTISQAKNDYALIKLLLENEINSMPKTYLLEDKRLYNSSFWYYLLSMHKINQAQSQQIAEACFEKRNGFSLVINEIFISIINYTVQIDYLPKQLIKPIVLEKVINQIIPAAQYQIEFVIENEIPNQYLENICYLDLDKLDLPITIRHPNVGDKFSPLGLKGHLLVSDFLNQQKITAIKKPSALLLCDKNNLVLASLPYRIDNAVKIDSSTRRIMKIILHKNTILK